MCIRDRDTIDNKTGRDLTEIEIFRLTREDKIFGEELREIKNIQRSENKLELVVIQDVWVILGGRVVFIEVI